MFTAIRRNLAQLTDFAGREPRSSFWRYLAAVVIVQYLISFVFSLVLVGRNIADSAGSEMSRAEGRAVATQAALEATPMLIALGIGLSLAMVALLAASFVRRLHDAGFSGLWAILPGGLAIYSAIANWAQAQHIEARVAELTSATDLAGASASLQTSATDGFIGWLPALIVIAFGLVRSAPRNNRWGRGPVPEAPPLNPRDTEDGR